MTGLNLHERRSREPESGSARVSIGRVLGWTLGAAGWLWAAFGGPASAAVAGDYSKLRDRVVVLETARAEDVKAHDRERDADMQWRARIEEKLDRLIERR